MLPPQTEQAVLDLSRAVASLRPLAGQLPHPVPIRPTEDGALRVLNRIAHRLGSPAFVPAAGNRSPEGSTDAGGAAFVQVVSDRLGLAARAGALLAVTPETAPEVDRLIDAAAAADFGAFCTTVQVSNRDGTRFPAYAAGSPQAPVMLIASACGMPARLAEPWIRHFAADHHVLTWESRGLFEDVEGFSGSTDVSAQAGDALAVLDHFDVETAHVVGLCGGAVIAVEAALQAPERVRGLSLWHGDFDLGTSTPKTAHQQNLQALMAMATGSRVSAAAVHTILCQAMLDAAPPGLAHLVLYPYVTADLLLRYCRLNGAIMADDLRERAAAVTQPTLVVTSEDDQTAHPQGSHLLAELLPVSTLVVHPHGDHLSVFRGEADLLQEASHLIRACVEDPAASGQVRTPARPIERNSRCTP